MYSIELDPLYEAELEQILISIVQSYTLDFAYDVVQTIDECVNNLRRFPKMYSVYADVPSYRRFVVLKKYTVFYVIDETRKAVIITHIFPSVRDLPALLG